MRRNFKWYPGGGVAGIEIDHTKPLSYSWGISHDSKRKSLATFYGYVTDQNIATVVLNMEIKDSEGDGPGKTTSMSQPIAEDRMFLFAWNPGKDQIIWKSVQGIDGKRKVTYEMKLD